MNNGTIDINFVVKKSTIKKLEKIVEKAGEEMGEVLRKEITMKTKIRKTKGR